MIFAEPPRGRVLTFGESLGLAVNSHIGSFLHEKQLDLRFGGAETNVSIGLRRLGIPATWISRLGDDTIGQLIRRELAAEGVDAVTKLDPDAPTGFMLKERLTFSRSNVSYYRKGSAASKIERDDIPEGMIRDAAIVHLTGITPALSESAWDATFHVAHIANALNIPVSFDLNFRSKLWAENHAAQTFRELIPLSSVVFAGLEEARLLFPYLHDATDLADALVDLGCKDAVIKQGPDGCTALIDGQHFLVPAVPIAAIDTVGAGDAFVAGYLAQELRGGNPEERLRLAVMTGAHACLSNGDWEGALREDEIGSLESRETVSR